MRCCSHCEGPLGKHAVHHFRRSFCCKHCRKLYYAAQAEKLKAARKRWGFLARASPAN